MTLETTTYTLEKLVQQYRQYPAIISTDLQLTYEDFYQRITRISELLKEIPLRENDTITLVSDNSFTMVLFMWAAWLRKLVVTPLNPSFPPTQLIAMMKNINSRQMFVGKNYLPQLREHVTGIYALEDFLYSGNDSHEFPATQEELALDAPHPATIIYTSGSTGSPRAALHSLRNHFYSALGSNQNIQLHPGDRWLLSLPLYHVGGIAVLFRTLLAGAAVVIPPDRKQLYHWMTKFNVTHLSLVSTQLYRLMNDFNQAPPATLKAVLLGGSAIPASLIREGVDKALPLFTSYGSTEMSSQICTTPPGASPEKLMTSGRLLPYRELKISQNGEILVRGKTLFLGYVKNRNIDPARDEDGWFHTGDLGEMTEDGYLIVHGRKDNMFISGGENIQPEEIERVLLQWDGVTEAMVVPVRDVEFGFRPVAFIAVREDVVIDDTELRLFLESHLPRFKIPIRFFDFPETFRNKGLKISRKQLQSYAQEIVKQK